MRKNGIKNWKRNPWGYIEVFKKMKEEDYNGNLDSMEWLRARINRLNMGDNSWQRNSEISVGCSEERETLEHIILHCPR